MLPFYHKSLIAFTIVTLFTLAACTRRSEPIDPSIPKALQDETPSIGDVISKRGSYDSRNLVDKLFQEILDNRPEVAAAVDSQEALLLRIGEVQNKLHESDAKNVEYYNWAMSYANNITDSTLRRSVTAKVQGSEAKWKADMENRDALSATLEQRMQTLKNEVILLKIRLTLPQIEDFQTKNTPNLGLADGLAAQQARVMAQLKAIQ